MKIKPSKSHPLRLKHVEVNLDTGQTSLALRVRRSDCTFKSLKIEKSAMTDLKRLHSFLVSQNVDVQIDYNLAKSTLKELQEAAGSIKRAKSVTSYCGWSGTTFVTPHHSCGAKTKVEISDLPDTPSKLPLGMRAGSLAGYLDAIKPLVKYSRTTRLALGLQCASILAGRLDIGEPAIIHIGGKSGLGKTVGIRVALALVGRGNRIDVNTHAATESGMEDYWSFNRHSLAIFDELAEVQDGGDDPAKILKYCKKLGHHFASRNGRQLSATYRKSSGTRRPTWYQMGISTGEITQHELACLAGVRIPKGAARRMIDLPVVGTIFDIDANDRPTNTEQEQEVFKVVGDGISEHHGVALPAFVEWINDNEDFADKFHGHREAFKGAFTVTENWQATFVDKFAVSCAGGLLGIEAGIIPCQERSFRYSIKQLCRQALEYCQAPGANTDNLVDKVIAAARDDALVPVCQKGRECESFDPVESLGFRRTDAGGRMVAFLDRKKLLAYLGSRYEVDRVIDRLRSSNLLLPGTDRDTQPIAYPGGGNKQRRYYRLLVDSNKAS